MIDAALTHMVFQLNQHLRRVLAVDEDFVVLSNIVEQDGALVPAVLNKLVVFLVGIERDPNATRNTSYPGGFGDGGVRRVEPVFLNLLVMCAANLSGTTYVEALKLLSCAIAFFQGASVLDHHNCPDLDRRVERLTLEIENLSIDQLHNLWGIHSGRYLPSVLYRVRMVSVDPGYVSTRVPVIRQIDAQTAG